MGEQSLITEELRAFIGRVGPAAEVEVSQETVERARGVYGGGGGEPVRDGEMVPGFVLMSLAPGGEIEELRVPNPLPRSLMVSNEFALERPVRLGERLRARARIADINERLGGRFGHGIYVRSELEFFDSGGSLVGRTASTLMYYDTTGDDREVAS